jgi:hypothetical protein
MLRVTLGGAGAALLATAVYEFAGSILFPQAETDHPLSATREIRLLAGLLVALLIVAGVVLSAGSGGEGQGAGDGKDLKDGTRDPGDATPSG